MVNLVDFGTYDHGTVWRKMIILCLSKNKKKNISFDYSKNYIQNILLGNTTKQKITTNT